MLLRASLGMAIVISCMGLAHNVYQLIGLRILQGVITGYSTACITLIATQTEKKNSGWALGMLSTATIAGSLLGPLIGGYLDEILGLQFTFFLTGGLMLLVFITTLLFVKENFVSSNKEVLSTKDVWNLLPYPELTLILFITSFILQLAYYSIEPIITVYISQLSHNSAHIALISGMAFSASGLASIIAAPKLGKLSDRIGPQKVMLTALIAAGLIFIFQVFAKNSLQLIALRFLLGFATAGLAPSINTLVKKITPENITGRIVGFNMGAFYLGTFCGSLLGGQIASHLGIKYVFFVTSALLLLNAVLVYEKILKKLDYETSVDLLKGHTV
jgi:MFS family permease